MISRDLFNSVNEALGAIHLVLKQTFYLYLLRWIMPCAPLILLTKSPLLIMEVQKIIPDLDSYL